MEKIKLIYIPYVELGQLGDLLVASYKYAGNSFLDWKVRTNTRPRDSALLDFLMFKNSIKDILDHVAPCIALYERITLLMKLQQS